MGTDERGKVAEVAAGDEDVRLLGQTCGHPLDHFPHCADRSPEQATADSTVGILADNWWRLVLAGECGERKLVGPGREGLRCESKAGEDDSTFKRAVGTDQIHGDGGAGVDDDGGAAMRQKLPRHCCRKAIETDSLGEFDPDLQRQIAVIQSFEIILRPMRPHPGLQQLFRFAVDAGDFPTSDPKRQLLHDRFGQWLSGSAVAHERRGRQLVVEQWHIAKPAEFGGGIADIDGEESRIHRTIIITPRSGWRQTGREW